METMQLLMLLLAAFALVGFVCLLVINVVPKHSKLKAIGTYAMLGVLVLLAIGMAVTFNLLKSV